MYYKSLYRKSFIKPPGGGGGGYFFKPTWGGLIETELIWEGGLTSVRKDDGISSP